jgi:O-antigen/teichoic acid export membrane protein
MSVPTARADLSRSFRRGFATTFALDVITKVITAVTIVVLIRGLSVSSYAYVTLFLTVAQFAGSAAGGGIRTRYLREEAERLSRGGSADREDAFFVSLLKATVLILALGACALPLVQVAGFGSGFGGATGLVTFGTAFAAGFSASELAIARYQARRRFAAAGAVAVARAAALLVASVMILLTRDDIVVITAWLVAAALLVGAVSVGSVPWRGVDFPRPVRASWFNSEEAWLSLYYVAAAGFAYVDIMVAAALLSEYQVATLGASLRYLAMVQSPIPAMGAVLRVRTAQIDLIDSLAGQRAMILAWLRRTVLPAALFVATVFAMAPVIIPMVDGGKYPESVEVLQIFLLVAFSAYVTAPGVSILMTQRRYHLLFGVYAVGLLVNLAGDVALAPRFGIIGIAVVSSVVYLAIDIVLIAQALRYARNTQARLRRPQPPSAKTSAHRRAPTDAKR